MIEHSNDENKYPPLNFRYTTKTVTSQLVSKTDFNDLFNFTKKLQKNKLNQVLSLELEFAASIYSQCKEADVFSVLFGMHRV